LKYAFGESAPLNNLKDATVLINATLIDDENIIFRVEFSDVPQDQYKINAHFYDQLLQTLNYHYPLCDIAPSKMFLAFLQAIGKGVRE
jgi:hypothetical protein